jgi:hypothetical protein
MGKYGAACDNLLSAQLVTVDGRQVEASQKSNPDLFWAIRGGGGNFGVVTALEYQLHPVGDVLAGSLIYPAGRIPDLLQTFTKFVAAEPDEMDVLAQLLPSPAGPRLKIDVCYCGGSQIGNDLLRPLRALKPQDDSVKVRPYLEAQAEGGFLQAPVAHFQTNLILRELSESGTQRGRHCCDYDGNQQCAGKVQGDHCAVTRSNQPHTVEQHRVCTAPAWL